MSSLSEQISLHLNNVSIFGKYFFLPYWTCHICQKMTDYHDSSEWIKCRTRNQWQTILTTWIGYLMNAGRWYILVIYLFIQFSSNHSVFMVLVCGFQCHQFSSIAQLCPTLCDPMDYSMPSFPVQPQLPELALTHVHQVGDAIQPPHPLSSPSSAFNLSQH